MSVIVACPSISLTTLGWTPRESNSVAPVWRRSWKRIAGNPARRSAALKRAVWWLESSGPPVSLQNTRSRYFQSRRHLNLSLPLPVFVERGDGPAFEHDRAPRAPEFELAENKSCLLLALQGTPDGKPVG